MKLTAQAVHELVTECLFRDGEDTNGHVFAEGVMLKVGFHPERLEAAKPKIKELLEQLPKEFQKQTGGGWSFLNACVTKDGQQWGEHRDIDSLLCLGIATKQASILMPRDLWPAFPGGMPYFSVL